MSNPDQLISVLTIVAVFLIILIFTLVLHEIYPIFVHSKKTRIKWQTREIIIFG